jgi:uncharacterized protein (DUF1499 family)
VAKTNYLRVEFRTIILRFEDDVEFILRGDDPDQTIDQRNVSGSIRTEIPSELPGRVCLSIQSPQIKEHR